MLDLLGVIWENKKKFTAFAPGSFGCKCGKLLRNRQPDVPILPSTICKKG